MTQKTHKTQKTAVHTVKKKHKKSNRTRTIFWVCLVLLLTPCVILAWILISSALDSGSPVLGHRYDNDLNPAITKTEMKSVKEAVSSISGVESVDVEMATATLRIYADITDSATSETAFSTADSIYTAVTQILDPSVYFTQHDDMKMYDLDIHVYNLSDDRDSDAFVYVEKIKNSGMEEPTQQLVSTAIDEELAQSLRDEVEARKNPTPTPESSSDSITVGGQDNEDTPTPTPAE